MKKNKHGLSRHIPAEVKREIRKNDGYGCILCGDIFIQYEHIDPLWCDAQEHVASKMALLCSSCHDKVTHKRIAKAAITRAKENPYSKRKGYAKGDFNPHPENMKIQIGNSTFSNTDIAITLFGKPLIWVTQDIHDSSCPLQYCGIFFDSEGKKIAYLNKNTFIALIEDCDFQAIQNRIEVRAKEREINLILKVEGDEYLEIQSLDFKAHQTKIRLNSKKQVQINTMTFQGIHTEYCLGGLALGQIRNIKNPCNALYTEMQFSISKCVENIFGEKIGYLLNYKIFDLRGNIVGYASKENNSIYSLMDEYVGELSENNSKFNIVMYSDEYEDQEPIWISQNNKKIQMFLNTQLYDMSYRLFGFSVV